MADEPLTLLQVKTNLRISQGQTAEDEYLNTMIATARRVCERLTGQIIVGQWPTVEPADLPLVCQAMQLMIASWYVSRDVGTVPESATILLSPLRTWRA